MKGILLIAFSLLLIFATCRKSSQGIAADTPRCIVDEIVHNQHNEDWMMGRVEEYRFQNQLLYAFQPDEEKIADGATTIKDEQCFTICQIGGFGGTSVNLCNGENFFQLAVLTRTIWKKR